MNMAYSFVGTVLYVSLSICLMLTGCSGSSKGGLGQSHAEALCDCFKAVDVAEADVEECNSMTKKTIEELQGDPDETLRFKQEMKSLCKKKAEG